ncbi:MAG TPA: alpha/beta hydrolase-fold protein [Bacteroidota bacterium]|nr:alpha/beta hydrolase-fold protein [Bacteroidota bacterium]
MLPAQTGTVFDDLSLQSKILKGERKFAVYLPPGYETSRRSYPVLYLLHGSGDDQTGWVQFGEVENIADRAIDEGYSTPMIIVMPDANTGRRGYANDIWGEWRYEDFFFQELIPYVEKTYRIKGEKRYRAVAGLSMGGEGTYLYALHHPEMFSSACPLSAGTGPLTPADTKSYMTRLSLSVHENPPDSLSMEAYYRSHSVLYLVENMPEDRKKAVRWYMDCGDDDFLIEGNCLVNNAMHKNGIPHEFRVRDGAHNWTYWRAALPEVLRFVSDAFHQY